MRFIRLSVGAMLILTAATASAQQPWAEKMFKDGVVHDFGSVPRGGQLFHRFKITNIYAEQMQITELRSGCGCVSASAAKRVLEPREEAFVEVNMDSRLFTGLKSVKVFVSVGPRFVSTAELRVSANSRADIVCNPTHIGFGTVAAGSRPTQTIDIEYAGVLDWKVTELVSKDVPVEATLKELYRRPGQVGYRLEAKLDADAPPGTIKRELFLKTNDPTTPLVPVLVEATVQATLLALPNVLNVNDAHVGEALTKGVSVRATRPFTVQAVEGLGNGITLASELGNAPVQVHILKFKVQPNEIGAFHRQLRIKTDLQEDPLVVTVSGEVRE